MQIIAPDYILTPTELLNGMAVAYESEIVAVAPLAQLRERYPAAHVELPGEHSLLMPGLINAHVHLEFSANKTDLAYGGFIPWLHSVIDKRDALIGGCDKHCMEKAVQMMLESGTTAFGAVSSYAMDLEVAASAPQKVLFFNELIGSQAAMADTLYSDFLSRLETSQAVKREGFEAAIAIHAPYSVHPALIKRAMQLAREKQIRVSAHFMESEAERHWLDHSEGDFKPFFNDFLKQERSVNDAQSFLALFDAHPTLMTHVVHANANELATLGMHGHTVIHCPISNRLLGNGAIDLDALEKQNINWICGTDGLSSNYRLDLFEELKIALFMHSQTPLLPLAQSLIESVTTRAAKALGFNCGAIAEAKEADMIVLQLDNQPNEQLPLHLLLHHYPVTAVYIRGNKVKG